MPSPIILGASTFVEILVYFFIFIPLILLWVFALVDLFMRPDLGGWSKAGWLLVIVIFPILGALIYVGTRPTDLEQDVRAVERP